MPAAQQDGVTMKRIGIISGMPEELAALLPDQPATHSEGPLAVRSLEYRGKRLFLLCAGIGKVAAATAATTLHARHAIEMLLVIGTAGRIGDGAGNVFVIDSAVQADYGAQRSDGLAHYTAGTVPIGSATVRAFEAMALPDLGIPSARLATSDLFIECGIHAARVRDRLGVTLVDMETAAVAQAAGLLGIPWAAIKATTDGADDQSAENFPVNLAAAARASARAAERLIALL